ncbi:MAG: serine protein kinase RIO [Thermoplasmata archaeon]
MDDEKKLKRFEAKIDSWRIRVKDDDDRKTVDEVFDRRTLLSVYKLFKDGILDTVDFPISTGKEGNVFKCSGPDGSVALKVYRVSTATFKHISKYIVGDPRFRGVQKNRNKVIHMWARKENRNLERMASGGVRVPKPLACHNNMIAMEYIGTEEMPAPLLKDVHVEFPEKLFDEIVDNMRKIHDVGLVHGDISEYNVLMSDSTPVIIDVGQGVPLEHSMAEEWLQRDIANIVRYFKRLGVKAELKEVTKRVRGD